MNLDEVKNVELYPSDHIFGDTDRVLLCGSSRTGKTFLMETLVRRHIERFYRIVLCGNRNRLLEFEETKGITEYYQGNTENCGIFDPFSQLDLYN